MILGAILETGNSSKAFIVGDPNQSIFSNLGGFPMTKVDLEKNTGLHFDELSLTKNYRSSSRIISYFNYFKTYNNTIEAVGKDKDYQSIIRYNKRVSINDLEDEIIRIIQFNIDECGISPNEICILAPWWIHLSGLTRNLMARLPQYSFDGPGMAPFARDIDNFWYKLSLIILTDATPSLYIRRLRWANEIKTDFSSIGIDRNLSAKKILCICNSILVNEQDGLEYLKKFFFLFLHELNIDIHQYNYLEMHYNAFFESSIKRIERLRKEGSEFISHIDTFRKVFRQKEGITISTNHGVKGAEFDTVIAFGLLEDYVPHFSDPNKVENAKRILYVIASRARKNLYLISEQDRGKIPTIILNNYKYKY